jgi:ribonuclease HI
MVAMLIATVEALEKIPQGETATVYAPNGVVKSVLQWLPAWSARGMRKSTGRLLQHAQLWSRIDTLIQTRTIEWKSIVEADYAKAMAVEVLAEEELGRVVMK